MLIGYAIAFSVYASFLLMLGFLFLERKGLAKLFKEHTDKYSLIGFSAILIFFVLFSILLVSPVEQLYFDENIYEGIAINILAHGNAVWCQYGTGFLSACYQNAVYHDPVGWSAFIAIAFGIFGTGTGTSYGIELFAGAMSIVLVFLLSSLLVKKKGFAVIATLAFAVMPQLFIWSRTQADADLPFMMFATLSFLLFVIFTKRKSFNSLAAFAFSLDLASYMRIEALLLIPLFAVLMLIYGNEGIGATLKERYRQVKHALMDNTNVLILILAFVLLILAETYYVVSQAQNPQYGQNSGQSVISLTNFNMNFGTNLLFLFDMNCIQSSCSMYNQNLYPTIFHYAVMPLAILGILFLGIDRKTKNRFGILILPVLWFLAYFIFYTAFYAGSVTYGVDSRFMLQILPATAILAAFGVVGIAELGRNILSRRKRIRKHSLEKAYLVVLGVVAIGALVYPFFTISSIVTISPGNMPQQSTILRAINFFYANHNVVPANCLVFTFTPDIWYEVNRSAIQISDLTGGNQTMKNSILNYKCLVLDYGYWCVVPPYHDTLCKTDITQYKVRNMTQSTGLANTTFYQILNYS